jgi:hypothetical protein
MASSNKKFFAYPNNPISIGQTIEEAIKNMKDVTSRKARDVYGHFIAEEIVSGIDNCSVFVADISVLNFNVTYEIGYAIGKNKRILLTKNSSIKEIEPYIREVGIFRYHRLFFV